jgi:hypothetical protein
MALDPRDRASRGPLRLAWLWLSVLSFGVFLGCDHGKISREEAIFQKSQQLFEKYLNADAATARQCLEEEITLLENTKVPLFVPRQAFILFTECSRLYVLENRLGNHSKADLALIKARYWNLRRYESSGEMTPGKLEELRSFTPEKIAETIDATDKFHTKGKGPRYNWRE